MTLFKEIQISLVLKTFAILNAFEKAYQVNLKYLYEILVDKSLEVFAQICFV